MLRADRDQWRGIWKCGEGTAAEPDEGESWLAEWLAKPRGELPPIRADDIRSAAMRFPRKTSAVCGWHPRHFGLLASGTLQGLACILNMAESIGTMPTPAQAVVTRLITNKRRPIGLFTSLFRVWGKIRSSIARGWESLSCQRQHYNAAPGRHVGDAIWRAIVAAQWRRTEGKGTVEIMHDISKAFD